MACKRSPVRLRYSPPTRKTAGFFIPRKRSLPSKIPQVPLAIQKSWRRLYSGILNQHAIYGKDRFSQLSTKKKTVLKLSGHRPSDMLPYVRSRGVWSICACHFHLSICVISESKIRPPITQAQAHSSEDSSCSSKWSVKFSLLRAL